MRIVYIIVPFIMSIMLPYSALMSTEIKKRSKKCLKKKNLYQIHNKILPKISSVRNVTEYIPRYQLLQH